MAGGGAPNSNEPKRTNGRFAKGTSGNPKGRPRKKATMTLDFAEALLRSAELRVPVVGRRKKVTALEATFTQLAYRAARGEKGAPERYLKQLLEAARLMEAEYMRQSRELGEYLRARDAGNAPLLNRQDAAYYQRIADRGGYDVKIIATAEQIDENAPTDEQIKAVINHGMYHRFIHKDPANQKLNHESLVRRILVIDRAVNRANCQPEIDPGF